MRFMTIDWWGGDDDSDRANEYLAYLDTILPQLPPDVLHLSKLSLHDANLIELALDVRKAELLLRLELPGNESSVDLTYSGLESFKSTAAPDEGLAGPGGYGDLGYDEIDISASGLFVHRTLFSNGIEFEIIFVNVTIRGPRPT